MDRSTETDLLINLGQPGPAPLQGRTQFVLHDVRNAAAGLALTGEELARADDERTAQLGRRIVRISARTPSAWPRSSPMSWRLPARRRSRAPRSTATVTRGSRFQAARTRCSVFFSIFRQMRCALSIDPEAAEFNFWRGGSKNCSSSTYVTKGRDCDQADPRQPRRKARPPGGSGC